MVHFNIPIIVEGRYDKSRIAQIVDAVILTTNGFGIFKNEEKKALIKRLGARGIVLLCDSDGGGTLIRSHLGGMLGGIPLYHLYIPQIKGVERRKNSPSKAGFLGVEGMSTEVLLGVFRSFAAAHPDLALDDEAGVGEVPHRQSGGEITKALMFELGLTGGQDSASRRDAIAVKFALPRGMNANAMCAALNMLSSAEELRAVAEELDE